MLYHSLCSGLLLVFWMFQIIVLSMVNGALYYKGQHVRTAALETLVIQGARTSVSMP